MTKATKLITINSATTERIYREEDVVNITNARHVPKIVSCFN